ncbi:helix-turn-helix domain-containing protein [Legionella sp. 27fs60]|uniref:Helix-turn-helix domain-containing protein n=1 Tax=Legionella bononiensis TaxID=2793102 RepID=A0ABS1WEC0_9GAMM|nr:helix-turn-helix domain-containing protein [Legionella bononiensis]MBL7527707.1 helix-turn-helix domain-containing protein [Legionella bononiensis]MBL7563610.1 helix-turn-helix domain-containing protein [Legionella bononiensis]
MKAPDLERPLTVELLGEVIKARRTQSDLRLEDAAALSGVAKETFMKIEHGKSNCQLASVL